MGRIKIETKKIGATSYISENTYDFAGRLSSIKYPDDYLLIYQYYPGTGLLHTVSDELGYEYASYSDYKPTAKIEKIDFGNGVSNTYIYDPYSTRLTGYNTQGPNGILQERSYVYTKAGDILSLTDNITSQGTAITYTYGYDNLHRLTSESNSGTYEGVSYQYDNIGNITYKTVGPFTSSYGYTGPTGGPHAVNSVSGQLGNGYNFESRSIDYNVESMPTQITDIVSGETKITQFAYDGNNARVKKVNPDASTSYYIGNHYEVINNEPVKYIFGNNLRIAQVKGTTKSFFHKDHLGSSTVMSDGNGAKIESTEYMPYGKTRAHTGQDLSDYKFTDQELDKSTGFYNYDARLYDPLIGRFVIADSIVPDWSDPQSLNRYAYCQNNPIKYTDPTGHWIDGGDGGFTAEKGDSLWGLQQETGRNWESSDFVGDPKTLQIGEIVNFNPKENNPDSPTVDSTRQAVNHYYNGKGQSVNLGPKTQEALKNDPDQLYRQNRITSGKTSADEGNYGVDLTDKVFHVGDTKVEYYTTRGTKYGVTTFKGFSGDGFWDVLPGEGDRTGQQNELPGGTPYPYNPFTWTISYPKPK